MQGLLVLSQVPVDQELGKGKRAHRPGQVVRQRKLGIDTWQGRESGKGARRTSAGSKEAQEGDVGRVRRRRVVGMNARCPSIGIETVTVELLLLLAVQEAEVGKALPEEPC